jgi:TATA-box binding protein (TBP) (component of TFIID and TFIIIB)
MTTTFTASPLTISTMTVTGNFGATPDLKQIYEKAVFIPYWWIGEGIIKIQYGDKTTPGEKKGMCTDDILHNTAKEKKIFQNQSSLVFRLQLDDTPRFKEVNIKIFKNGGFQMTGISSEETGRKALTRFLQQNSGPGLWTTGTPHIQQFNIQLINSDFTINKDIRRDRLYRVLVEKYGIQCSFNPMTYQAVKAEYFWNTTLPKDAPRGICACPSPCEGDGDGTSVGNCRRIVIAPFRTGKTIITAAKNMQQLHDAYEFINGVFRDYADFLLRDPVELPTKKKSPVSAANQTSETILRQKMRASPRNVVKLPTAVE